MTSEPPVTGGASVYRSQFSDGALVCAAARAGTAAGLSGEMVHKYRFCDSVLSDVCSEIPPRPTLQVFNRGHAAKIMHVYVKIYGLT